MKKSTPGNPGAVYMGRTIMRVPGGAMTPCKGNPGPYFRDGIPPGDAERLCSGCPVTSRCLATALRNREEHGVWGGTTPKQRRAMWRKQDGGRG